MIDKTGLQGLFDVRLQFTTADSSATLPPGQTAPQTPSDPSLFTAIQEQLGLKLEPARSPVEMLVIENVQKPSEN